MLQLSDMLRGCTNPPVNRDLNPNCFKYCIFLRARVSDGLKEKKTPQVAKIWTPGNSEAEIRQLLLLFFVPWLWRPFPAAVQAVSR